MIINNIFDSFLSHINFQMEHENQREKDLIDKNLKQSFYNMKQTLHGFTILPKNHTTFFQSLSDLNFGGHIDEIEEILSSIDSDIISMSELYTETQAKFETLQSQIKQYASFLQ